MSFEKKYWNIGPFSWVIIELLLGSLAMLIAYHLTPASLSSANYRHLPVAQAALAYAAILAVTTHALGLHNNLNLKHRWRILILSVCSVALALTLLTTIVTFVFYSQIGRIIIVLCAGATVAIGVTFRLVLHRSIQESPVKVRVVGDALLKAYLLELAQNQANCIILLDGQSADENHDIVVVQDSHLTSKQVAEEHLRSADQGLQVFTVAAFVENYFYQIPIQYISPIWLFSIDFQHLHPYFHSLKRTLDIIVAGIGLIFCAPIVVLAATAIRLESPGSVFYSQIRVGLFQRPFRIWKLRTMRIDAEKSGPQWASPGDSRVTWIGRILRKTRIDELPQFWNILRGDMAFVGPRPERPEFVDQLAAEIPYYRQRHLVKPGLTGWAQICYPYGASTQDAWNKLSYDFYYMKNSTLTLDLQILLQTVGAVSRGAR